MSRAALESDAPAAPVQTKSLSVWLLSPLFLAKVLLEALRLHLSLDAIAAQVLLAPLWAVFSPAPRIFCCSKKLARLSTADENVVHGDVDCKGESDCQQPLLWPEEIEVTVGKTHSA